MHSEGERTDFVDFVDRCLEWKPDKRMKPSEAMKHRWIKNGLRELGFEHYESKPTACSSHTGVVPPGMLPRI
jgi:serine/threonine protein kinase